MATNTHVARGHTTSTRTTNTHLRAPHGTRRGVGVRDVVERLRRAVVTSHAAVARGVYRRPPEKVEHCAQVCGVIAIRAACASSRLSAVSGAA